MTTDKILSEESARQFLNELGLKIDMQVILQVIDVLNGKRNVSLYELYAQGKRRDGGVRKPLCGKGTIDKINRLYKTGKLEPFLEYLNIKSRIDKENALKADLNKILIGYEQKKYSKETRAELQNFIGEWDMEINLPLNWLDSTNLSTGKGGIVTEGTSSTGHLIPWESTSQGDIVRMFRVEDRDEFKIIYKDMANYGRVWKHFRECKLIGGGIIKACSKLGADIREQSESRTGLKSAGSSTIEKPRLDGSFAWIIYADSLAIFGTQWEKNEYHFVQMGQGLCVVWWGNDNIAVVGSDYKDKVVSIHRELRASYRESKAVQRIHEMKQQLDIAESHLRKELDSIKQGLAKE